MGQPLGNWERSEDYGALQRVIDSLFSNQEIVRRLDAVIMAETLDLPEDLLEIVNLLPPGNYSRQSMCTQLNSAIAAHAWGQVYGMVE